MNPSNPETKVTPPGFASLADAKSALKLIVPPVTEEARKAFMTKLAESEHPRQVAFRLLALLVTNKAARNGKILSFLQSELTNILAGSPGTMPEELPGASAEEVKDWVRKQFPSIHTKQEATKYLESEQHLWTLYQILRWAGDSPKFMAAIGSFAEELALLTESGSAGKTRREGKIVSEFAIVVAMLIKRVPSRPAAIESLLADLRLCRAFIAASGELQDKLDGVCSRNERLKKELETEQANLATEKTAHAEAIAKTETISEELRKANAAIQSLENTLKIQAGAHKTETVGASAELLTALRRKLLPDLENIRLYADRAEPNAAAIVRKAQELTQFLNDFNKQ